MMAAAVRPYLMDLGSTNGTYINNERLDNNRYYELLEQARSYYELLLPLLRPSVALTRVAVQDLIKFGNSTREYVLIHEKQRELP